MDRGTELKAVLHYKITSAQPTHSTSDAWPCHQPKDHVGAKDTIYSGRGFAFFPLHCEASQRPSLPGLPPVFILFFEGSLTHQEGINCAPRGTLVASYQAPPPLLSRASACWLSPSPRKASCGKKTTLGFEFVCSKMDKYLQGIRHGILQSKKAPQFRRLAMKQTTMLVVQHFPLPQT